MRQIKGCLQAEPCDYSAAVRKILLLLALAGVVEAEVASQAGNPRTRMAAQLEKAVTAFKGQMGVAAIEIRTGETIAVNATRNRIPLVVLPCQRWPAPGIAQAARHSSMRPPGCCSGTFFEFAGFAVTDR